MYKKVLISVAAALALSGPVFAGTPALDQREANQAQRIRQGVRSGELTRAETARVIKGQRQLRRMERRAKSDGVVTASERARLQHKANKESRRIYRKKHNDRSRG
ncbi:MAG: hypothetical protein R3E77_00405 [Steroidobacteraceae bacterium]